MPGFSTIAPWLNKTGYYGPVTSTLDWCEANYQFSPYIAEMANSLSNLYTIVVSVIGYLSVVKQGLPKRYILGYLGIGLVGIGSFLFHATLLYEAQLADELPMIYVGSMSVFITFDDEPGFGIKSLRTKLLLGFLLLFDAFFTWSYYLYRNPIYHQVVFAIFILITAGRITYILKWSEAGERIPTDIKHTIGKFFGTGALLFAFGFLIWNLDNIFCDFLITQKLSLGWPSAFLLEGHSWWHILTGLGTYYMFVGIQCDTLCVKDDYSNYTIGWDLGLPYIERVYLKRKN
ncbi:alkaline phytoceramidase [Macrolepiota fuliginosa MF-IS2]|uniref:Alkaline phytoceramidase n=1 Tax=Macrolepiota fuliginosa MF-IS2 TaxID=1400762 RepID=A0A9P5XNU9_9AGAR|nr:alkaline phytoceramidase [Macrolepiota fuliginosa MF-IS2]